MRYYGAYRVFLRRVIMKPTPLSWEATKESVNVPLADTPTTISYTDINDFKIPQKRSSDSIPVYYHGVTFPSISQCTKAFGVDRKTIRLRMQKARCTFAEALDFCIEKRKQESFVDCLGVQHKNLAHALRYYKVNYYRVVHYAKTRGITGNKNIVDTLLQNPEVYRKLTTSSRKPSSDPVIVNGKEYPSRSSCFAALGLCESTVTSYIRNHHVTVEEAVNFYLAKKAGKIKGKTAKPTADNPSLPSTTFDPKPTAEKQELKVEQNVELKVEQSDSETESETSPEVTLTIQPSAQEREQENAQSSAQPIFELADEPRGRDLMIELLDLWTNLLRKHWLGEELMCDEWRENFREFEADMLALGYATATQVTRSNTNRMWRKDNITVK